MTDVAKLRDDVIEAAKVADVFAIARAVAALRTAEEAAKKPTLRPAHQRAAGGCYTRASSFDPDERVASIAQVRSLIEARDSEWMAAIRKLPVYLSLRVDDAAAPRLPGRILCGESDCVRLSDIEALAESAK